MNKTTSSLYTILMILILIACGQSGQKEEMKAVPADTTIKGTVDSVKANLIMPAKIKNINNEYLVIASGNKNGLFKVFSLPQVKFLYTWGRRGKGPNEFSKIDFQSLNTQGNQLIIYEDNYKRLSYYTITDTVMIKEKTVPISPGKKMALLNHLTKLNDSTFISESGPGISQKNEFVALKPKQDNPLFMFGKYPDNDLQPEKKNMEFGKVSVSKPDGSKFYTSYFYYNRFKIFNNNGSLLKDVSLNNTSLTDNNSGKRRFIYRGSLYAGNTFIYAFALNATKKNYARPTFQPTIEIFTWKGKMVDAFKLDKPINEFTVSEKNGEIYGFSAIEKHQLYEFNLPQKILNILRSQSENI